MLIQKYQTQWADDFNRIKTVIQQKISDITIEHIGSTSVKKLEAKPIIDIDIVYYQPENFEQIKFGLEELGYYHNGNQGIIGREAFKRKKYENHSILDSIQHHLYVCHVDSEELKRHLAFRDYLRKHEIARVEYQKLKHRIADKTNQNRKEYAKLKEIMAKEFIENIINQATMKPKK